MSVHPCDVLIVTDYLERLDYPEFPNDQVVYAYDASHMIPGRSFRNVYVSARILGSKQWRRELADLVWVAMSDYESSEPTAIYRADDLRINTPRRRAFGDAVWRLLSRFIPST